MKITVIPEILSRHLKTFRKLMSKPQFAHFTAYCTGLIAVEKKNINQIADALPHGDQSSLNRFVTRGIWNHASARDKALDIILAKMQEIISSEDQNHYKNLKKPKQHLKRVHINKSFVLTFSFDPSQNLVSFEDYDYHDNVY